MKLMYVNYEKECGLDIIFLALRFNHDQFNWSQQVLLKSLGILNYDTHINLEHNRIDAIIKFSNKILKVEHKFVGLLVNRKDVLIRILKTEFPKILRKSIDLVIITTITFKQPNTDVFLSSVDLCLHVILLKGDYVTTIQAEKVAEEIINAVELDDNEYPISPVEAKMLAIFEMLGKNNERRFTDLEKKIVEIEQKMTTFVSQVNDVKSQVNDVKSQVNDVKSQVVDVESQVNDVKTQIAISNSKLDQLLQLLQNK